MGSRCLATAPSLARAEQSAELRLQCLEPGMLRVEVPLSLLSLGFRGCRECDSGLVTALPSFCHFLLELGNRFVLRLEARDLEAGLANHPLRTGLTLGPVRRTRYDGQRRQQSLNARAPGLDGGILGLESLRGGLVHGGLHCGVHVDHRPFLCAVASAAAASSFLLSLGGAASRFARFMPRLAALLRYRSRRFASCAALRAASPS